MRNPIWVTVVAILIAIAVGYVLGYSNGSPNSIRQNSDISEIPVASGRLPDKRNHGITITAPRTGDSDDQRLSFHDERRENVTVPREILSRLSVTMLISGGTRVSSVAKQVLDLTPQEVSSLEKQLTVTIDELHELELINTEVDTKPDGAIEIKVNGFVDDGSALRNRLIEEIEGILGFDRAAVFEVGLRSEAFSGFGQSRRLLIARPSIDPSSKVLFTLEEHFLDVPHGQASTFTRPIFEEDRGVLSGVRALPFDFFKALR